MAKIENNCPWQPIHGFQNLEEFHRFENWLLEQIKDGYAEELPVDQNFQGVYWSQRWFKHKVSGQIWRLVSPDAPFPGLFENVVQHLIEELSALLEKHANKSRLVYDVADIIHAFREPDFASGYSKARTIYAKMLGSTEDFSKFQIDEQKANNRLDQLRQTISRLFQL